MGQTDADRQRRFPGILARAVPQADRRGVPFQLPYRRLAPPLHPRKRHRHPAHHRSRYHDGIRRMPPRRLAARLCGKIAASHPTLAGTLLRTLCRHCAEIRPQTVALPHRTGVHLSRPAGQSGGVRAAVRCGRLCHRRPRRRRTRPGDVRDDRNRERHTSTGQTQ